MDQHCFDTLTRSVSGLRSRRTVLGGLVGAGLGWGVARLPSSAEAKNRRKRKQALCRQDGSPCRKPGNQCRQQYCLNAPFTIEAQWTQTVDHATFLFVPSENATTGPAPYIDDYCNPIDSSCDGDVYPFACVSHNARGPGDEITTIYQLLPGKYEYWIGIDDARPAGEVTAVLKDSGGRVVRQWTNPASATNRRAWHVFDVDGHHGRVTAIDELISGGPPQQVNDPSTDVCTYGP